MSVEEIVREVQGHSAARHVVLTGGEPMIARGLGELAAELKLLGYHLTIETAATVAAGRDRLRSGFAFAQTSQLRTGRDPARRLAQEARSHPLAAGGRAGVAGSRLRLAVQVRRGGAPVTSRRSRACSPRWGGRFRGTK